MVRMSSLRPLALHATRSIQNGSRPIQITLQKHMQLLGKISVRNGGGANKMAIQPSRYEWQRFKNDLHFYVLLGVIPLGAITLYANLFVGPAELSDIPEGYEPKEWEYFESPVKRWFAKYAYEPPSKTYEKTLHYLQQKADERYWNMLEAKVKTLSRDRQDYKGWYWIDMHKGIREYGNKIAERDEETRGV